MTKEKVKKMKLFTASALLATGITLLPGCHQVLSNETTETPTIMTFESVNETDKITTKYNKLKQIETTYSKINDESVKVREILEETTDNNKTIYTTGKDLMIVIEGNETTVWFSSNITPSDAYSAIASFNEEKNINSKDDIDYLNPTKLKYIIGSSFGDIDINYNNGKLEIKTSNEIKKITVCEVTPSKVKELNGNQTEEYILKQRKNSTIPNYALTTLRHTEEMPILYLKDSDTLSLTYDGNYYETYIGFAEKDFDAIPFFKFEFNSLDNNNHIVHKT